MRFLIAAAAAALLLAPLQAQSAPCAGVTASAQHASIDMSAAKKKKVAKRAKKPKVEYMRAVPAK